MMRRLLQPVWVLLAIIFLIEAWLWDHLEPVVAWFVALIPLRVFKHWLAERVENAVAGDDADRLHRAGDTRFL